MTTYQTATITRNGSATRLSHLDVLRFGAAFLVVIYHYTFAGKALGHINVEFPTWLTQITRYGYLGVELFFMISGFVVLMSAWGRTAYQFLVSRLARLYPAYWAGVLLTTGTLLALGPASTGSLSLDPGQLSANRFLVNLTMLQSFFGVEHIDGVYWTLARELSFYLLILLLIAVVGISGRSVRAFAWAWLAMCTLHTLTGFDGPVSYLIGRFLIPDYAAFFIAGMAFYLIHRDGWRLDTVTLLVASYAASMLATVREVRTVSEITESSINPVISCAVVTACFAAITWLIVRPDRTSAHSRTARLGALTYPLYLLHCVIGFLIFDSLEPHANRWALLVGVIALMLAASWAIERYVETPGRRAVRRLMLRDKTHQR